MLVTRIEVDRYGVATKSKESNPICSFPLPHQIGQRIGAV